MDFDAIRPIFSGLIGGVIAIWLTTKMSRWIPDTFNSKTPDELLAQHRIAVRAANALFFLGLVIGIALYKVAGFADTDWRPLAWGFGLSSVMPLIGLPVISAVMGRSPKEAYVAFAVGQKTPFFVTYGILGLGVVAFFLALASLGT